MNNFYVYIYLDPMKSGKFIYQDLIFKFEPIYVGKGIGDRINKSMFDKKNIFKLNKISKIINEGFDIIKIKLYENLKEDEAFFKEIETIHKIGKLISKNVPLVNILIMTL